jgi:hypothetical protein
MQTKKITGKYSNQAQFISLLVMLGLIFLSVVLVRPFYLDITDQAGPFYLTFSPADLDLDGDLDVLVHNMRKPGEFVAWSGGALWTNQGGIQGGQAGQFAYRLNDIEGGWTSTTADLDGDGYPDVLVYEGYGRSLRLGINAGKTQDSAAGVFKHPVYIPIPDNKVEEYGVLITGDINGDERIDSLLLGRGHFYVEQGQPYPKNVSWVWLNKVNSDGYILKETAIIAALDGLSVADAALGDLDGDSDLDLVIAASPTEAKSMDGTLVLVLLNNGAGSFSDSGQRFPAADSNSLAMGDLDSDGDLDILLGYASGVMLLMNQGGIQAGQAGSFTTADSAISGGLKRSVFLSDMDGDGDQDALLVGNQRGQLWWNSGNGSFTRSSLRIPFLDRQDFTVGDFNGDGSPDIFVAEYDKSARVWFNDGKGNFRTD